MFNKKVLFLTGAIALFGLTGCSSQTPVDDNNNNNNNNDDDNKDPNPDEPIDRGTVSFQDINVYKNYDGVRIVPVFSNPTVNQDQKFVYTVENEDVISIDEDLIYRVSKGNNVKVTAKSQDFEETFFVNSKDYYENGDFLSKIKQRTIDRTGANQGTSLFLGDSFFEFWKNKTGINESFATAFEGKDVCNIGISATQTCQWRSWVSNVIDDYMAKNIVINIGINDVDDANLTGVQAAKNVISLIEQIHISNEEANIYWFTLTRCSGYFANKWNEYQLCNEYVKNYSQYLPYLKVLDIASLYGDDYASYQQDGLHPNQAGYDLFKQLIEENIDL